jgi:hypothetical protein
VGDEIEKNEMGGACSSDGGGEACTGFCWENLRVRDHWGDPGVDGGILLRWIFRKWDVAPILFFSISSPAQWWVRSAEWPGTTRIII